MSEVAEAVRAEEWLRLQASALESAANGIIITDRAGTIVWVNPSFPSSRRSSWGGGSGSRR